MNAMYQYFMTEMKTNIDLYVEKSDNTVNLTLLAEGYIDENDIENEEEVFEGVIDWFESSTFRHKFNH